MLAGHTKAQHPHSIHISTLRFLRASTSEFLYALAKAKGVKFGRPPLPLPENFYEVHKSWRAKKITLKEAAKACDMPIGTFYGKARKFENVA